MTEFIPFAPNAEIKRKERNHDWKSASRRFGEERTNSRYSRDGPLSPLRSPLRTENPKDRVNRARENRRKRYYQSDTPSPKKSDIILKKDEFPPLTDEAWTPEGGKWVSEGKKLDWSLEVEKEENQTQERSRRKLDLRDKMIGKSKDLRDEPNARSKQNKLVEFEGDDKILQRRQKDIDYGKNTVSYDRYTSLIERNKRVREVHPRTPNKCLKTSRRSWDAQVRQWRKALHQFDPPTGKQASGINFLNEVDTEDSISVCSSDNLVSIKEECMESTNSSDADDENSSQTSCSPGITLTPDTKSGPFKYPLTRSPKKSHTSQSAHVVVKTEKENDDGFFSGFDVDECLNEDMDTL